MSTHVRSTMYSDRFPIYIYAVNMRLSMVYFKGLKNIFSLNNNVPENCFNFTKQCRVFTVCHRIHLEVSSIQKG